MKKRSMALVLLMVLTMIVSGCGTSRTVDTSTEQTGTDSKPTTTSSTGTATSEEKDYSEHVTISLASVQVNESTDYNNGDDFTKWWRNKFNFTWEITGLNWDVWAERLRIWINAGDMPDVATWDYNHGEAIKYIEEGLIYRLPDDWKTRWPNVAKAYADSQLGPYLEEKVGGTYLLPKPAYSNNKPTEKMLPHVLCYIRKDWAEAVGFPIKDAYKTSEILEFCRLVKEQDPGNIGGAIVPIGIRPDQASAMFVNTNYTYASGGFYKGNDGKYHWGPADKDTLTGLKIYQEAYRTGALSPEFYANDTTPLFYSTGTCAVIYDNGMAGNLQWLDSQFKENLGLDYAEVVHECVIVGEDGKYHSPEQVNFWTAVIFSPDISQVKFERYMDMMDFASAPENQIFLRMGFQGIDWDYDENGELISLLPEGMVMSQKYPSIYPCYDAMYILADDFQFMLPAYKKVYRQRSWDLFQVKYSLGDEKTIPSIDWDVILYSSEAKNSLSYDMASIYTELILAEGDLETNWKEWVAAQASKIDPVLAELNENFGG